jgi:hypothetical protein
MYLPGRIPFLSPVTLVAEILPAVSGFIPDDARLRSSMAPSCAGLIAFRVPSTRRGHQPFYSSSNKIPIRTTDETVWFSPESRLGMQPPISGIAVVP